MPRASEAVLIDPAARHKHPANDIRILPMGRANELVVTEYRPLEIYTILVLEYLVVILIVSAGVRWLERRLDTS